MYERERESERESERERGVPPSSRFTRYLALDGWGPCQQSLLPPWPPATVGGALARGRGAILYSVTLAKERKKERDARLEGVGLRARGP